MTQILVLSDLHVGSVMGLCPDEFYVEGGGTYRPNEYQRWLNECWHRMCADIEGSPILVLNGDLIQGANSRDGQIVTNKPSLQADAALEILQPLAKRCQKVFCIRGTEWHEGKSANDIEHLARDLGAVKDPATNQHSRWELFLDVGKPSKDGGKPSKDGGGPVIHFAHHIGCSGVPWGEASAPTRDLLMFVQELQRFLQGQAPHVKMIVRSHRHRCMYVAPPPDLHAVITPAWQLRTAFSYKVAASMLPQVGYVLIDYDGRDFTVKRRLFTLPAPRKEYAA